MIKFNLFVIKRLYEHTKKVKRGFYSNIYI